MNSETDIILLSIHKYGWDSRLQKVAFAMTDFTLVLTTAWGLPQGGGL